MQEAYEGSTLRSWLSRSLLPCCASMVSSSGSESKWSSIARLEAPVMNTRRLAPASSASSTAYWMRGLSTTGSISLGLALVAGRNRVPRPATGNTAVRMAGCDLMQKPRKGSVPNGLVGAVIDPLAQILAGLEMGDVLAGERHGFTGL